MIKEDLLTLRQGLQKRKGNRIKRDRRPLLKVLLHPLFLKLTLLTAAVVLTGIMGIYVYGEAVDLFRINKIIVTGNKHLSNREVISLTKVSRRDSILTASSQQLGKRLLKSPWIKDVTIRKELPHTLIVNIKEAEPLALLRKKGHLYIVGKEGQTLEKLTQTIPFLPVIRMNSRKKSLFKEGLKLAQVIRDGDFFSNEEIEILIKDPAEITLKIGTLLVKVGRGGYRDKLLRFTQLEKEILKRGIPVDYVDLRFSKRVVIRPVKRLHDE